MTRFLSAVLGAVEPGFSQSIQQLEQAAGRPGADIRLTEEIKQRTRAKIAELGLDPSDTTGEELYAALNERLRADEARVRAALNIDANAPASEVVGRIRRFVSEHEPRGVCFALKNSVAKRVLKAKPPKAAMKRLGYRSLDSMLKHEHPAQVYAAAVITESASWHRTYREQYAKLAPADFESRIITVRTPATKRWQTLANEFASASHHHMLSFKELGAIVLLPFEARMDGLAFTTLLLVLEEMNAIRAHSSYAKLQQVKPDFGRIMRDVSAGEAYTEAYLAGQRVSWRMIQRYYAAHPDAYHPEIFEPHIQPEDLAWLHAEDVLAQLQPALSFWQGTQALGLLHADGQPVSCNALDVAVNHCNNLPFTERIAHYVRGHVWHQLMLRYLHQENLEAALRRQLSDTLSGQNLEPAFEKEEF
jgi:hypothetical protein